MVNVLMNLAVLYEDRGEYGAAERCLKQILAHAPTIARVCS